MTGRVPNRSAAQPAGYRMAALASRPAANTAPTSAAEPPLRPMKIGSSGRKNHNPIDVSRLPMYSVHKVRRCMRIGNTGRAVIANRLKALDWDLIPASPHRAHVHMALDEVLLGRVMGGARRPTARVWEWIEPALVIGSHQSVANEGDLGGGPPRGGPVIPRL